MPRFLRLIAVGATGLILGGLLMAGALVGSRPAHAATTYLEYLVIDTTAALDPSGRFQRVYVDASSGPVAVTLPSAGTATILDDSARTTVGGALTVTLAHSAGHLVWVRGFRVTGAPIAAAASGQVQLTGLANGKTFSYEFAAVAGVENQLGENFGEQGLPANDGNTDVTVTVPALLNAVVSATIWGYRV